MAKLCPKTFKMSINKVRYQLVAANCITITRLIFDDVASENPTPKTGTHQVNIVGTLDIEFECLGSEECIGENWQLFVWVDDIPITTSNRKGYISGGIANNGKSRHYGGYSW